jgi:hypothetical protein
VRAVKLKNVMEWTSEILQLALIGIGGFVAWWLCVVVIGLAVWLMVAFVGYSN